jgi:hypothetical protein
MTKTRKNNLKSSNKFASVNVTIKNNKLSYNAKLKNTNKVSAVHIHQNKKGKPGPILSWIATSNQWNNGVLQNKKGINKPCCGKEKKCNLTAPKGTRKVKSYIKIKNSNTIKKQKGCKGTKPGLFLVIHGKKYQYRKKNKTLSKGKPGLNIIKINKFI